MVGHNPTMAYLAQLLDDGTGDEEAGRQMATGFPTGALARFAVTGPWIELDLASARSGRVPRRRPLTVGEPAVGQTGGAGVTTPCSASSASISSRLMPSRYRIASR